MTWLSLLSAPQHQVFAVALRNLTGLSALLLCIWSSTSQAHAMPQTHSRQPQTKLRTHATLKRAARRFSQNTTPLQKGMTAFQDQEYDTALTHFQSALKSPSITKVQKLQVLRYMAVCYYNQGELEKAATTWKQALKLDKDVEVPPGQDASIQQFFRPISAKHKASIAPPKRRTTTPLAPQTKPAAPFFRRHIASSILLGVGVLSAITAGIFTGRANTDYQESIADDQSTNDARWNNFGTAGQQATIATILWSTSGALALGSVVAFVLEPSDAPVPINKDTPETKQSETGPKAPTPRPTSRFQHLQDSKYNTALRQHRLYHAQ